MKQIGILFSICLFQVFTLAAQNINIPDQCFINALILAGVDTNEDELISYAEAEAVDTLILYSGCITDLRGIEAFTNLIHLQCSDNRQLKELDLSSNTKLRHLECGNNLLSHLDLSHNTSLEFLYCPHNNLTRIDITHCSNLDWFMCSFNDLDSLDLTNNTQLTSLWCGYNQITSLDVSACTGLNLLQCPLNQLQALDLTGLSSIKGLNCSYNLLTSLELSDQSSLDYLSCEGNYLRRLDLSSNIELVKLDCSLNQISTLDVSMNPLLGCLNCGDNNLTHLDISNNIALDTFDCRFGPDLSINNMPSLQEICVWELPFPPPDMYIDTLGSPNLYFTVECIASQAAELSIIQRIYPNPAHAQLTLQTYNPGVYHVLITSTGGQHMHQFSFTGTQYLLDLSLFPSGIYFLRISSKDRLSTEKIIKL